MSAIQGLDTIPREIAERFGADIKRLLPGWSENDEYNFQAGAALFEPPYLSCAARSAKRATASAWMPGALTNTPKSRGSCLL